MFTAPEHCGITRGTDRSDHSPGAAPKRR